MAEAFEVTATLPATPKEIYDAWLDGKQHAAFTGARATCEPRIGGAFTAWDGYIRGHIVDLFPGTQIVQEWITTEFPAEAEPSRLEIDLEANNDGTTLVRLRHSNLPDGTGDSYKTGWDDHYFKPMTQYFQALRGGTPKPPPGEAAEPGVGPRTPERTEEAARTKATAPKKAAAAKKAAAPKPAKKKAAAAKKPAGAKKKTMKPAKKKAAAAKKATGAKKKKPAAKKPSARKTPAKKRPAKKKAAAKKRPAAKKKSPAKKRR